MAREVGVWLVGAVWLSAVAGGLWVWERYDTTPGAAGSPATTERGAPGRWTLTVFVHPKCPCSRATFAELTELARAAPDLALRVLFVLPPGADAGWERGDSWDAAARVPGAEVGRDDGGAAARRFGAETSGHAVLTAPDGAAVFRGGLTPARGRVGESAGRRAVLAWLQGREGAAAAPVFGCALFAPAREPTARERQRERG